MRPTWRSVLFLAVCSSVFLFGLIFFYGIESAPLSNVLPAGLRDQWATESTVSTKPATSIPSFWKIWSQVFIKANPHVSKLKLWTTAGTFMPSSQNDGLRHPAANKVNMPKETLMALVKSHATIADALNTLMHDTDFDLFNGTGIVTVAGGEYFGPALISIHMLRRTNCTLPVQVFLAEKSEYETKICDQIFPSLNAQCIVLSDILQIDSHTPAIEVTHYQLKSLAILLSSFSQVLYLDSDSIPLLDPTEYFTSEPFQSSGLVIWPDFWIATESPLFYQIASKPGFPPDLPLTSSETGQLLLDKAIHLETLLLAVYYNIYGPDFYYALLSQGALGQGDKETFLAAASVLEKPWYRVSTPVEAVKRHTGKEEKGSAMVQRCPSDDYSYSGAEEEGVDAEKMKADRRKSVRPAFLHANTPKMNAGHLVDEGDLLHSNKKDRLRLWGSKEEQVRMFGQDLEKTVWEYLVQTGCELEHDLTDWKKRDKICERLEEHWDAMFADK